MSPPNLRPLLRFLPFAVLLAAGTGVWIAFGDSLSLDALRANRAALLAWCVANPVAAAAAYVACYTLVVTLSLPGSLIMTLAGGFLFGPVLATPLAVIGATLGATLLFVAAKSGIGDALHARVMAQAGGAGMLVRLERGVRENAFSVLLLMRLMPAIPFFVANLAPAFLGVRLRTYVLTTFLGIIPATAVYASVGAGLGEVFDRGATPDLSLFAEPAILLPLLGLALLAALPLLLRLGRGSAP